MTAHAHTAGDTGADIEALAALRDRIAPHVVWAGIQRGRLTVTILRGKRRVKVIYATSGRWVCGHQWMPADGRETGPDAFVRWIHDQRRG
jgi:hypothetical protein